VYVQAETENNTDIFMVCRRCASHFIYRTHLKVCSHRHNRTELNWTRSDNVQTCQLPVGSVVNGFHRVYEFRTANCCYKLN